MKRAGYISELIKAIHLNIADWAIYVRTVIDMESKSQRQAREITRLLAANKRWKDHVKAVIDQRDHFMDENTKLQKELDDAATLFDLIRAVEKMNSAAIRAISGGMIVMPRDIYEPETMHIAAKAEDYLEDSMNISDIDIAQIHKAIVFALDEIEANK